jgi:hypothetical protein
VKLTKMIVAGAVVAAIAAPLAQAGNGRVQLAGSFVAPGEVSEAQLSAGHAPSTRLVQIGGALVAPSQVSAWQDAAGDTSARGNTTDSSGIGTGSIAAFAALGCVALLAAASALIFRHRRRLVTA